MKKAIIIIAGIGILIYFISCSKVSNGGYSTCTGTAAVTDSTALLAFAKFNGITPVADTSSWLYYQIINKGSGASPTGTSKITISYVGTFLSGQYFDSTRSPETFELDSLITGWQYGLPKIQAGGRIKLLVPSALAFGCAGTSAIPPNSPLYFDITLISVH
jgi:FKBP-type peptidyl-prolyl cis-trans isomerase FkpA